MRPHRYAWFARRLDPRKASIRLRLIAPMAALRRRGIDIEPWRRARADDYDAVIFSKSFTKQAVALGRAMEAAGRAVIVDICDNMFDQAERAGNTAKRDRIVEQLGRATLITVATPALADQIERHMPGIAERVRIVPDMLDDLDPAMARPGLVERWRLARLDGFLRRHPGALHCVWFGKSSGDASGHVHLDGAARTLESFAADHAVTLTVIGDDRAAWRRVARNWAVPSHYLPWSLDSFAVALRRHRVALIPVGRNAYTAGKTINRPATAILAGLGVVADAIDSYQELRPFVALDDWAGGLARYATDWPGEQARLAAARRHLLDHYGPEVVAGRWAAVLDEFRRPN